MKEIDTFPCSMCQKEVEVFVEQDSDSDAGWCSDECYSEAAYLAEAESDLQQDR